MTDKYSSQKTYLATKKQLRVWLNTDKYEKLKEATKKRGESIYGIINKFVDDYLETAD